MWPDPDDLFAYFASIACGPTARQIVRLIHDGTGPWKWPVYQAPADDPGMAALTDDPIAQLLGGLSTVMRLAPVIEAEGRFEPRQDETLRRPASEWRWIIAVREHADPVFDPHRRHSVHTPRGQCYLPSYLRHYSESTRHALFGRGIVDLVACSVDLKRVTSRLLEETPVIGWPWEPALAREKIRVHETPLAWLMSGCDGVTLAGTENENQAWLLAAEQPLVVSRRAMGEALQRKMIRGRVAIPSRGGKRPAFPQILIAGAA